MLTVCANAFFLIPHSVTLDEISPVIVIYHGTVRPGHGILDSRVHQHHTLPDWQIYSTSSTNWVGVLFLATMQACMHAADTYWAKHYGVSTLAIRSITGDIPEWIA